MYQSDFEGCVFILQSLPEESGLCVNPIFEGYIFIQQSLSSQAT